MGRVGDFLVGKVSFPLTNYMFNRKNVIGHYKELIKSEVLPDEVLRDIQMRRFKDVITYAYQWCPFYTRKMKDVGALPGDFKRLDDLKQLPVLTRKDILEYSREMVDFRYSSSIADAERPERGPGTAAFCSFRQTQALAKHVFRFDWRSSRFLRGRLHDRA